jgi:hypothetical protein
MTVQIVQKSAKNLQLMTQINYRGWHSKALPRQHLPTSQFTKGMDDRPGMS